MLVLKRKTKSPAKTKKAKLSRCFHWLGKKEGIREALLFDSIKEAALTRLFSLAAKAR
jgi:hypothetical protein